MQSDTPNDLKILVLGESHTTAISKAVVKAMSRSIAAFDVRSRDKAEKFDIEPYQDLRPSALVLAFGGTEHNIVGLIEANPRFDFILPPFDDFDVTRQAIPASAIELLLSHRIKSGLGRALLVRAAFDCPVFALAPPPPFREIDEQTKLPSAFSGLLQSGITPAAIRRKLYAIQCHMMSKAYAEHGISLISAPTAALDSDGFLHRKLWGRDPTHGNERYGSLLLTHLTETIDV